MDDRIIFVAVSLITHNYYDQIQALGERQRERERVARATLWITTEERIKNDRKFMVMVSTAVRHIAHSCACVCAARSSIIRRYCVLLFVAVISVQKLSMMTWLLLRSVRYELCACV